MAKKKKKAQNPSPARSAGQSTGAANAAKQQENQKVNKRSTFLFWFILVALLVIFGGSWVRAIMNGYYTSFVERGASVTEAVANMDGLTLTEEEAAVLLPLEQEWDLYTSARLRDEVYLTAQDGTRLHAGLYDEGSEITVVVVPRFDGTGEDDFLPGVWLNETYGCNLLLLDPRAHGESEGDYFTYGITEQQDLADWLSWAEETLGTQTFLLWGEGTGANTILFAEASGLLPDSVAWAVAESPYDSLHTMANRQIWKWYQVPSFPFLNAIELKTAHSDAGFAVKDVELGAALSQVGHRLPVLFLTSEGDEYILPEWSTAVYDAYDGPKAQISAGQTHGTAYAYGQTEIVAQLTQGDFAF